MATATRPSPASRGFTLVEVLVALLVMAMLAAMAWQGLDGIARARSGNDEALNRTLRLNTALTQWEQDLQAVHNLGAIVPPLAFDGQTLRLTRRAEGGLMLVAWSVRGGVWQRWATPAMRQVGELQEAWLRSQQLLGNEAGQVTLSEATTWQVYFYRGNAWSNAQSSADRVLPSPNASGSGQASTGPKPKSETGTATPETSGTPSGSTQTTAQSGNSATAGPPPGTGGEVLPQAVRMVITLGGASQGPQGTLTRDIALGPVGGS